MIDNAGYIAKRNILHALHAILAICTLGCTVSPKIATVHNVPLLRQAEPLPVARNVRLERLGENLFRISFAHALAAHTKQPENSQMCWAACVEMVLNAERPGSADQDFLNRYFAGGDTDASATIDTIVRALAIDLDKQYNLQRRLPLTAALVCEQVHSDFLIESLSRGKPVIIGLRDPKAAVGHVCVIIGATYSVASTSGDFTFQIGSLGSNGVYSRDAEFVNSAKIWAPRRFALHDIEVLDPDPDSPLVQTLDAITVEAQTDFLVSEELARAYMREAIREENRRRSTTRGNSNIQRARSGWSNRAEDR